MAQAAKQVAEQKEKVDDAQKKAQRTQLMRDLAKARFGAASLSLVAAVTLLQSVVVASLAPVANTAAQKPATH